MACSPASDGDSVHGTRISSAVAWASTATTTSRIADRSLVTATSARTTPAPSRTVDTAFPADSTAWRTAADTRSPAVHGPAAVLAPVVPGPVVPGPVALVPAVPVPAARLAPVAHDPAARLVLVAQPILAAQLLAPVERDPVAQQVVLAAQRVEDLPRAVLVAQRVVDLPRAVPVARRVEDLPQAVPAAEAVVVPAVEVVAVPAAVEAELIPRPPSAAVSAPFENSHRLKPVPHTSGTDFSR